MNNVAVVHLVVDVVVAPHHFHQAVANWTQVLGVVFLVPPSARKSNGVEVITCRHRLLTNTIYLQLSG